MGLIWKRDPLAMLLEGESPHAYMDLREEFELHGFLTQLENLRSSATSEMGLRGPFPNVAYGRILKSTASMLDAFHAMNVIIMKDCKASKGEAEILGFTVNERNQLGSRISHLFQGNSQPYSISTMSDIIVWISQDPVTKFCSYSVGIFDETRIPPK